MFTILKLIQSIIKTLHSDGTPGQVGAGIALGSALGLTPLVEVHNLVVFALLLMLNVSFGGGMTPASALTYTVGKSADVQRLA